VARAGAAAAMWLMQALGAAAMEGLSVSVVAMADCDTQGHAAESRAAVARVSAAAVQTEAAVAMATEEEARQERARRRFEAGRHPS